MRVGAEVTVSNRGLAQHNMRRAGKAARASLALGRKKVKEEGEQDQVFLLLCTAQNRGGTKYRVTQGNLEKIFGRFSSEGKATLRMKDPAHDLCLSRADPVELRAFLSTLSKAARGDAAALGKLTLSALQPASASQLSRPITRMEVLDKKDYPITKGFPAELETLRVSGIQLKKVDSRIFRLRRLVKLDLSDNRLPAIPEELGLLKNLQYLDLCQNEIECVPRDLLRHGSLGKTLQLLNLSRNKIEQIPSEIVFLMALRELVLDHNSIKRLPLSLERLKHLRHLSLASNPLISLPGCIIGMRLEQLNVDAVAFPPAPRPWVRLMDTCLNRPAPLVDQAMKTLCNPRNPHAKLLKDPSWIPQTLVNLYESRLSCAFCGKWIFWAKTVGLSRLDIRNLRIPVLSISNEDSEVPAELPIGACCYIRRTSIVRH